LWTDLDHIFRVDGLWIRDVQLDYEHPSQEKDPQDEVPRVDSGVVTIDSLHFLAECCKRRLNQVLSVLYISMFFIMLLFVRAPFMYC